jgi:hypothetical protein
MLTGHGISFDINGVRAEIIDDQQVVKREHMSASEILFLLSINHTHSTRQCSSGWVHPWHPTIQTEC